MLHSTQVRRELDENRARPGGAGVRQASEHFVAYQKVRDGNIFIVSKKKLRKRKRAPIPPRVL